MDSLASKDLLRRTGVKATNQQIKPTVVVASYSKPTRVQVRLQPRRVNLLKS